MAEFTKTTEIDISAMHEVIEEETPKKNKWRWVLSIIISIVLAFIVWLYVTEVSTDEHTKVFYDIQVVNAENETVNVAVTGTYSELADLKKDHIVVNKSEYGVISFSLKPEAPSTLRTYDLTIKE
ncbi:MAG: hypothetical protein J6C61_03060 [Clostridia bacterium]|nr:hypothetical protein [Clostridia bacterium]